MLKMYISIYPYKYIFYPILPVSTTKLYKTNVPNEGFSIGT